MAGGVVFLLDQITKAWVLQRISSTPTGVVFSPLFAIVPRLNPGAAFGLWPGQQWLFVGSAVLVTTVLLLLLVRHRFSEAVLAPYLVGAVLGGVWGNIIDRLRWGAVVDFLGLGPFPLFNLADTAIVVGSLLLVVMWWRQAKEQAP